MQKYHGVIDSYLAIDATIDGNALAKAAAAGAAVAPGDFPEIKALAEGKQQEGTKP
jgi:hypothetical protein